MVLKAIVYEHGNFQGRSQELIPGSYNMASLGIPNDSLSSLKVEKGLKVTLFEHEFTGRSKTFTEDASWVGEDFNDITSSIKVEELVPPQRVPKAIIYEHSNFQGRSQQLIPGSYNMASLGIPNDSLSSLKVETGLKVTLFEHEFTGRSRTFTEDTAWVGDDFNDITSSVKVEEIAPPPPPGSKQFQVPGTAEGGVEFTNTQTTEVSYTFTPTGTWTPNVNNPDLSGCTAAGVKGYPPEIQKGILDVVPGGLGQYMKYPNNTPFALLAVSKQTGAVVAEVGQATTIPMKPGETLVFVLNDMWGGYSDNSGTITVNWSAKSPQPQSGTLQVPANSLPGVPWANTSSNSVRVQLTASGQWTYNPGVGMHGAGGHPSYPNAGRGYRMPGRPEGALIARRGNGSYEFVGQQAILTVAAGETISLTINDDEGGVQGAGFRDNQGAVTVQWTVVP
jgi:hypothetical protein